jgi:predicted nucleic acid-binding Zn ribbon protein
VVTNNLYVVIFHLDEGVVNGNNVGNPKLFSFLGDQMQTIGLVLRDTAGYEWSGDALRPKHHAELAKTLRLTNASSLGALYAHWHSGKARLPQGFELYDPFTAEPALFEIAARLQENASRDAVMAFANDWGDIGTPLESPQTDTRWGRWQAALRLVNATARTLGKKIDAKAIEPRLWLASSRVESGFSVSVSSSGFQPQCVVFGLYSALIVQAIEAISKQLVLRNCQYCGGPMASDVNREDREFCSNSCRIQAFKHRKRKARLMIDQGLSLRKIVAEAGVGIEVVKRIQEEYRLSRKIGAAQR